MHRLRPGYYCAQIDSASNGAKNGAFFQVPPAAGGSTLRSATWTVFIHSRVGLLEGANTNRAREKDFASRPRVIFCRDNHETKRLELSDPYSYPVDGCQPLTDISVDGLVTSRPVCVDTTWVRGPSLGICLVSRKDHNFNAPPRKRIM